MNGIAVTLVLIVTAVTLKGVTSNFAFQQEQADNVTASLSCPPGFVPERNSCVCADWPNGMVICNENPQQASMQIGYCMTYDNETSQVRAGSCATSLFRNDFHKFYYLLPKKAINLNDQVCGPSNSKGLLCGECQEGFAASTLFDIECVNCTDTSYGWLEYLVVEYLPASGFLLVIVTFGISIVSGPANAFIFFSQVTTAHTSVSLTQTMYGKQGIHNGTNTYTRETLSAVLGGIYDTMNLNFFRYFIPGFCLTKKLNKLEATAMNFTAAVYPLLFTVLLYVLIQLHARSFKPVICCWRPFQKWFTHFKKKVNSKTSVIDAFATFILLSYVKMLSVAQHLLLSVGHIYNGDGTKIPISVVYYDPNIQYFHGEHLPFVLLAILILLTFILIPFLVLILYPVKAFQRCLTQCKMNSQALRTFVEAFHGCYKDGTDGTRDCRYFAGFYFFLRIIVLSFSFLGILGFVAGSTFLYLFTALLFAFVQPYKKKIYNVVDTLTFALLTIIYILIGFHAAFILFTGHPSTFLLIITDLLYMLPLLYLIIFVVCRVLDRRTGCIQKLQGHRFLRCLFNDSTITRQPTKDFDSSIPHRLLNPEEYEALIEENLDKQDNNTSTYGTSTYGM